MYGRKFAFQTGVFLHYEFGGLIFGGAYFQNFTVSFILFLDLLTISSYIFLYL